MHIIFLLFLFFLSTIAKDKETKKFTVEHFPIGTQSAPQNSEITLTLIQRFQQYNWSSKNSNNKNDKLDKNIQSPKSAKFSLDGKKLYIQSLERKETPVYSTETFEKLNVIKHKFTEKDSSLFQNQITVFDYDYKYRTSKFNIFKGSPVECCLSHNGKYLWVTYYKRNYDKNAVNPSAVAIIDTQTDSIVRVMPTGPLPKMIACSPDNKWIAITHWGDNTIGLININSDNVNNFQYTKHIVVDYQLKLNFSPEEKIDRDSACGLCLRGTVFTPDSKYLLVGRMGGGGISVYDMINQQFLGTVFGMLNNIRHLVIQNNELYISSNGGGTVQKTNLQNFLQSVLTSKKKIISYSDWKSAKVGYGVRTIEVTKSGKYIFACVNGENKISIIRSSDMKVIAEIGADSFPVGMALSPDESLLTVTSQGKPEVGGGNSVMIYKIEYQK